MLNMKLELSKISSIQSQQMDNIIKYDVESSIGVFFFFIFATAVFQIWISAELAISREIVLRPFA